jgi:hypothetical protein
MKVRERTKESRETDRRKKKTCQGNKPENERRKEGKGFGEDKEK